MRVRSASVRLSVDAPTTTITRPRAVATGVARSLERSSPAGVGPTSKVAVARVASARCAASSSGRVRSAGVASTTRPEGVSTCAKLSPCSVSRLRPMGSPARAPAATSPARARSPNAIDASRSRSSFT
ncbi:MAG: hypothetical protein AAGC46_17670 [Solirubrobacteraceae bacterium]|nr:hypothetical protein [Patulibacter sp.]